MNKENEKYESKRIQLQAEVNGQLPGPNYAPQFIPVDKTLYVKTDKEKKKLQTMKHSVKASLLAKGLSPKKFMNVPLGY